MDKPTAKRTRSRGGGGQTKAVQASESKLVQARVPRSLYNRIEKAASAELISVSAYIRRTLSNHVPGG